MPRVERRPNARMNPGAQTRRVLRRMFALALRALGPQHWWPGDTPLEVCVGAILTQNTAWVNVERAIANLKSAGALAPCALHTMPHRRLAALIRPAGYFNVKARRLKAFIAYLIGHLGGRIEAIRRKSLDAARRALLTVHGIGPETADSMLLYAAGFPVFVCDAYTRRILHRHGLCAHDAEYHAMQDLFHRAFPRRDAATYNEFHALIVAVGKDFCRPRHPRCDACPLGPLLTPAQRRRLQISPKPDKTPRQRQSDPPRSRRPRPPAPQIARR